MSSLKVIGVCGLLMSLSLVLGVFIGRSSSKSRSLDIKTHSPKIAPSSKTRTSSAAISKNKEEKANSLNKKDLPTSSIQNLEVAIRGILAEADPRKSNRLFQKIVEQMKAEDFPNVLRLIENENLSKYKKTNLMSMLLSHWTELDPHAALSYARAFPDVNERDECVWHVFSSWPVADIRGGFAQAQKLPEGSIRSKALSGIMFEWAEIDPVAAAPFLDSFPNKSGEFSWLAASIASNWANTDGRSAIEWANKLPNGSNVQAKALEDAASRWAQSDLQGAISWLAQVPEGTLRKNVISGIIGKWTKNDPYQASVWLSQLPAGSSRDWAVKSFSRQVVSEDPQGAVKWVETIVDGNVKNLAMMDVGRSWLRTDPKAAKVWISQSSLSDKQKTQLLGK